MLAQMGDDSTARPRRSSPRRELALVLLLGAAGAGLVFLATRQGWAQVQSAAPKPLPASVVTETGQDLVPAAGALAVAALASLAAVLATRGVRAPGDRGGAGRVRRGHCRGGRDGHLDRQRGSRGGRRRPGSRGGGAGSAGAGSVTAGSTSGSSSALVAGFPGRVVFAGVPWHVVALAGAVALVAAGVLVAWRAERLPVMSSRFDSPAPARAGTAAAAQRPERAGRDAAAIWESLSRGDDPTAS